MIKSHYKFSTLFFPLFCLLNCVKIQAQNTLELAMAPGNNSYGLSIPKGPTSIPQTLRFFVNQNGNQDDSIRFSILKPELLVTFSLEDQQYLRVPQHITGITFGALPGASSTDVRSAPVVSNNYSLKDSSGKYFTSHPSLSMGHGINLSVNMGIQVFVSSKPLMAVNADKTDSSRYYYGKIKLLFNRPVNNPVISLFGLGATTNFANSHLGLCTELELETPKLKLQKLSASDEMLLDESKTKILHTKTRISGTCGDGAICGSVLINGQNISSLVFNVFLRADGGPGVWGNGKINNSGDSWHMTVSLAEQ